MVVPFLRSLLRSYGSFIYTCPFFSHHLYHFSVPSEHYGMNVFCTPQVAPQYHFCCCALKRSAHTATGTCQNVRAMLARERPGCEFAKLHYSFLRGFTQNRPYINLYVSVDAGYEYVPISLAHVAHIGIVRPLASTVIVRQDGVCRSFHR